MNDALKWIIMSATEGTGGKYALDRLALEYKNIPDSDPAFYTPAAQSLQSRLENPPVEGVHVICYPDSGYPSRLKNLSSPPAVLYVRGDPSILDDGVTVAVVGSRNASAYGLSVTMDFCRDFCEMGLTIISGGARGVDSAAAETALKFGGKTVAVLGCGLDIVYPAENRALFEKIISSGGAVISEYPFGTNPIPAYFPRRNRIIAALADCCVVTEAGLKSGSLITANLASELRKPLFAVPGNITSRGSMGTNHLIKTGASLAVSGMQVAAELKVLLSFSEENHSGRKSKFTKLPMTNPAQDKAKNPSPKFRRKTDEQSSVSLHGKKYTGLNENESKVVDAILSGKKSLNEIAADTGISEVALASELIMMELKGIIKKEYGEKYSLI